MTHTYAIEHMGGSTESVTLEVAPKTEMKGPDVATDPKTGEVSATYSIASGDPLRPSTIAYKSVVQTPVKGTPVRHITVVFITWATDVSSVTDETVARKVTVTQNFYLPADLTIELADFKLLVGTFFSFLYPSVSAGAFSTTWLSELLYGVTQVA